MSNPTVESLIARSNRLGAARRTPIAPVETPRRQAYIDDHGKADPLGAVRLGFGALSDAERRAKATALAAINKPMVGHFTNARPSPTSSPPRRRLPLRSSARAAPITSFAAR